MDEIHQKLRGTLHIGLFDQSTTNPEAYLHESIRRFDIAAPDVDLEISIEPPNVVEARVIEGTIDIGIVPYHRQSESLNYLALYSERMTLIAVRVTRFLAAKVWTNWGCPKSANTNTPVSESILPTCLQDSDWV